MTMTEDTDKPTLNGGFITQALAGTICLKEGLLREFLGVGAGACPPVSKSE
jgi:hypothetical protein